MMVRNLLHLVVLGGAAATTTTTALIPSLLVLFLPIHHGFSFHGISSRTRNPNNQMKKPFGVTNLPGAGDDPIIPPSSSSSSSSSEDGSSSTIFESIQESMDDIQENIQDSIDEIQETIQDSMEEIQETIQDSMEEIQENIQDIQESFEEFPNLMDDILTGETFLIPEFLRRHLSGGRAPGVPDKVDSNEQWEATPAQESEARLIILHITDVYTLDYFAHFKTLLEETREKSNGCKVVCMLTGDFLSPYLLASVDRGAGMMHALSKVPMDYLTWGNHEADIEHNTVCRHVRNFQGKWINSNMLDHDAMDCQQEYDVIELLSPDKSNVKKVGLCAVLSDDPDLYSHFEEPGAFGGATITCPWDALRKYETLLKDEHNCDMVLPLQHTYVPDDHKTCEEFDFPLILSGHDHHMVDEVVNGTRLIKPGMNGVHAAVIEISWPTPDTEKPIIRSRFVKTDDWEADEQLAKECNEAYNALAPLSNTELAKVPKNFEPLSSSDSRGSVCSMGKFICTLLRSCINMSRGNRRYSVDAVLLMGGNIRGNADYDPGSYFSLEALEAEIKSDEVVAVVPMPGWLLAKGVEETHSGDPIPGWMQYDEGVQEEYSTDGKTPPVVTHVGGKPIDPEAIYRVLTKVSDLTNGQSPTWTEYYKSKSFLLPPSGSYVNIHAELMGYFARNLWRNLWVAISKELEAAGECKVDGECTAEERLDVLDTTGDGIITVDDIQVALRDLLGYSVDAEEPTLAKLVHSFADTTGDGTVTKKDFQIFCEEMVEANDRLPVDSPYLSAEAEDTEAILEESRAER